MSLTEWGVRYRYKDGRSFVAWGYTEKGARGQVRYGASTGAGMEPKPVEAVSRTVSQ
jgi:hypothetical protein